ncbi:F5/8 type C domain protein [Mycobacterium kansasii]|uniref:F5/8 type C domain protein n=1 Tax=Mycobacterium kansasii TaxID=1768 RepID=A0A1V3WEA7_MYCKA|nr:F5/8 type C domain protein [Mycobacterium kansasii]
MITAAAIVILLVALAAVNYLTSDVNPHPHVATPTATVPPPPPQAPLRQDTILKGVTASDLCPRDANYSDANRAFDGDFNTAWVCTRAKNQDGQTLQVDFGRQVTLTQLRVIGGFDATAPTDPTSGPSTASSLNSRCGFPRTSNATPSPSTPTGPEIGASSPSTHRQPSANYLSASRRPLTRPDLPRRQPQPPPGLPTR